MPDTVIVIANGDLRLSANQKCWPAQAQAEEAVMNAIRREGRDVRRGHACDPVKQHGFIDSQKHGMEVFRELPPDAPLVVVEAVWQYSHHILHGLYTHQGPILTVANWSGQWPGLVGMLNLNASMTKAGITYSTLWSEDFTDEFFLRGLRTWLAGETVQHDVSHARALSEFRLPAEGRGTGQPAGGRAAPRQGHHGRVRRGLHGHVQRHHPRRTAARHGRVQGAAEPVGAVCRDAAGERWRRRRRCGSGWTTRA